MPTSERGLQRVDMVCSDLDHVLSISIGQILNLCSLRRVVQRPRGGLAIVAGHSVRSAAAFYGFLALLMFPRTPHVPTTAF